MKKGLNNIFLFLIMVLLASCGSSSSSSSGSSGESTATTAADHAVFGTIVNEAFPAGLKTSNPTASLSAGLKALQAGDCATSYQSCPTITQTGGADATTSEILLRLWALDYESECTAAYLADGTCIDCPDCETGAYGTNFIKPTLLSSPSSCASTSSSSARYVNFGVDPCFFDTMINEISNVAECEASTGTSVDISSALPWYSSWGLPRNIEFSGFTNTQNDGVDGGFWWTVNAGTSGEVEYFLSLDTNWLYAGIKDPDNDKFIFIGTGSPSYYEGIGEGNGINISAYAGTLSAIPSQFEAIQVRDQDSNQYIERMRSNGSYLWYQSWTGDDFPLLPGNVESVKDNPTDTRCVSLGDSIELTKYVPASECVNSFGVDDETALNDDDLFTLKLIDAQTAGSIDFSTGVTEDTTAACMAAPRSWQNCVSGSETVTDQATSGGNLALTTDGSLMVQYYGGGHDYVVDGNDMTNWSSWSGAQTSRSVGDAKAFQWFGGSVYLASIVSSPIPGIYVQKNTNNSSWTDYSNQLTGFSAYNIQFGHDSVYFYISYAGTHATGPVRVFRLPIDESSDDWEAIGLDIATTTSHSYVMDVGGSNNIFVSDTSSGLSVTKYTNSDGSWSTVGDQITTSAVESHDMDAVNNSVLMAWTLPSSYQLTVALNTGGDSWQTIGDLSGIRASGVKIDYVGGTIYILYKDVNNANALTVKTFTLGSDTSWNDLGEVITANGPTVYDFEVMGQTPYVIYSHTSSGQTPLVCRKYAN